MGVTFLAAMMFLTAADVILRYIFNMPVPGSYELTEYMMTIVISFGLAYCALEKGHVRIDMVVEHFPKKVQAVLDSITSLVGVALFVIIAWQSFLQVVIEFDSGVTSTVLYIPVFPFVAIVAFGSATLAIAVFVEFIEHVGEVVK